MSALADPRFAAGNLLGGNAETSPSTIEAFEAGAARQAGLENPISLRRNLDARYAELADKVFQSTGERIPSDFGGQYFGDTTGRYQAFWSRVDQIRKDKPQVDLSYLPEGGAQAILADEEQKAKRLVEQTDNTYARAGAGGTLSYFAGSIAGWLTDPAQAATTLIGGGEASLARFLATQSAVNVGTDAVTIPLVAENKRQIGIETHAQDVLRQMILDAVAPVVIGGTARGVGAAFSSARARLAKALGRSLNPAEEAEVDRVAADMIEAGQHPDGMASVGDKRAIAEANRLSLGDGKPAKSPRPVDVEARWLNREQLAERFKSLAEVGWEPGEIMKGLDSALASARLESDVLFSEARVKSLEDELSKSLPEPVIKPLQDARDAELAYFNHVSQSRADSARLADLHQATLSDDPIVLAALNPQDPRSVEFRQLHEALNDPSVPDDAIPEIAARYDQLANEFSESANSEIKAIEARQDERRSQLAPLAEARKATQEALQNDPGIKAYLRQRIDANLVQDLERRRAELRSGEASERPTPGQEARFAQAKAVSEETPQLFDSADTAADSPEVASMRAAVLERRAAEIEAESKAKRIKAEDRKKQLEAAQEILETAPFRTDWSAGVDPRQDSIAVAIAKMGGMNSEDAVLQFGLDPAVLRRPLKGFPPGKQLFKRGGHSLDNIREDLVPMGYVGGGDGRDVLPKDIWEALLADIEGRDHPNRYSNAWLGAAQDRPSFIDVNVGTDKHPRFATKPQIAEALRKGIAGESLSAQEKRIVDAAVAEGTITHRQAQEQAAAEANADTWGRPDIDIDAAADEAEYKREFARALTDVNSVAEIGADGRLRVYDGATAIRRLEDEFQAIEELKNCIGDPNNYDDVPF